MILKLWCSSESPGRVVKTLIAGLHPEFQWGLKNWTPNKFPDDAGDGPEPKDFLKPAGANLSDLMVHQWSVDNWLATAGPDNFTYSVTLASTI